MKKTTVVSIALLTAALLSACGTSKPPEGEKEAAQTESKTSAASSSKEASTPQDTPKSAGASSGSGEVLNPNIAVESEGNVEVVYTNKAPGYTHNMNGFKVSVDEYQIVKVTGMNKRVASIPFQDQTDGYVVTAKVTIDNAAGKAMYYNNMYRIQLSKATDYIPNDGSATFVRKEDRLKSKQETETSKFAAGEKVTGLLSFTLTNEQFESLKTVKPKFVIEDGAADNSEAKDSFKGNAVFDFFYSEEQKKQVESEPKFYPDRLTTDNMADKKMIFEKTGIGETKQIGDLKVTLDGVQYAEIVPTAANQARFKNFGENGIVAVTVKLLLDNQSDKTVSLSLTSSKLRVDQDRGTALSEGMVEPNHPRELAPGSQGEKYHVFLFRKDEFGLFKSFQMEFGPVVDADAKRLFKEETATFTLPR
ncbi:hypothetical protein PM3016_2329 [Paenibacillus mucilaginosus 3016]|uniref:DUF5068 domain-containing protein n=1 Tax=Paenibacillus mucilaginosus 3016 TaxID=1116391 RepID=H6NJD8_9BACL|nr:DUF5068 domain-containing protein [Paenibacillus mucilaginosus]AFC29217.1 hypothetical protein PM3016_2329 [Paenibacillus mucilaginosus 3016]WFA17947.1 DUF5068 domain-containing protein [Paenibacillus mucilaginosus]